MPRNDDLAWDSAVGENAKGAGERPVAAQGTAGQDDFFKSLADHSLEFIGMCDLEFRPFYVNEAGRKLVGLDSLEEACGVKVQDFFFPEDQGFITEHFFPKVLKEGRGEVEIRFRHFKTGAALWMIYNVFELREGQGRSTGYATVSRDITERKQAEDALRKSEERYRILVDGAVDGIFVANRDGRYVDVNPAGCAMLGMTREEVLRSTFVDVLVPEEHERLPATIAVFADGKVHLSEWRFRRNDGSVFVGELAGRELPDGRLQGIVRDTTDRKRAEEGLRTERDFSSAVLETAGALVVVMDNSGRIRRFNRACAAVTGYAEEEVLGRTVLSFIPPEDMEGVRQEWDRLSSGARKSRHENHWLTRDGRQRLIAWSNTVLAGPNGEVEHIIGTGLDITEQRRAEEERERLLGEVERERARLEALLKALPVGVWVADASGKMILVNEAAAELFSGQAPAVQRIGEYGVYRVLRPGTREPLPVEDFPLVRALRGEIVRGAVLEHDLVDGSRGSLQASANPIRDGAGKIVGAVVTAMDISARKQAERVLRESQDREGYLLRLADVLRPLSDPVQVQEAAARVLAEHLGVERVLYFEVGERDYVVERDYARGVAPLRGRFPIVEFGQRLLEEYRAGKTVVVKDLDTEPSLSAAERASYKGIQIGAHVGVPLVKGERLVAGLAVHAAARREWTGREVELIEETAERTWSAVRRARAEEALRRSEENYRTLFTSMDEGYCVIEMLFDREGEPKDWRFVEVNPAFERHNGLREATGKTIRELTPGIEEKWFDIYGKVALTGQAIRFEESSEALNRWFDLYAFRVGEPKENKVAVLFSDITSRKKAEVELRRYREELERLVAERTAKLQELVGELEHFSYTITHDLKAPLRAMRGFAEMASIACEEGGGKGAKEFLDRIGTSAERMDRLIADALNYSRSVRQELPLEDVDAGALLRGMLDSYPEWQPERASIRMEGDLPVVLANQAGLTQVFSNLVGNAVKFVRRGEKPDVRVWGTLRSGWVRIWVEDKGIGISKEMRPRLFDMFARGSKEYEGTGIGLALVRKVVQRMGGKVGVESVEGEGSRFWIELKCGEAGRKAGVMGGSAAVESATAQVTVLYVEDEESDAMFMGRAFAARGLAGKLQVVGDGRAAIEYLSGSGKYGDRENHPVPAVVVLDLNLPQVSGFDVLEWMRNNPDYARTPVVVFSSSTRADDRMRAEELGADEFVAKPNSGLEFAKVVERIVGWRVKLGE